MKKIVSFFLFLSAGLALQAQESLKITHLPYIQGLTGAPVSLNHLKPGTRYR
ncbi:hypothetical protein [Leadbetterella sp. DM7]|uniref:hypothetical protein n=1 Tax=Leadbetterella sp. DM7 TaxID=3235085 RepID=UPI00349EC4FC